MLDRTQAPPSVAPVPLQLPIPDKNKFAGGAELYHIAEIQQEIVSIEIVFKAGGWYAPQPAVPYFMAHMLEKGTTSKSASQIAASFDRYGAYVEIKNNFDFVFVTLYTLNKHLSILLALFFEILSQPTFPEEELIKMKDTFLQDLAIKKKRAAYLSSTLIRKKIFGENHPYGQSDEEDAIRTINRDHLHSFFTTYMQPTYIFALGKINSIDMACIKAYFDDTKPYHTPKEKAIPPSQKNVPKWVEKKDSVQSSIRLAKRAIPKTHPDYFNLSILNYHLGGYFGSRLMQNLREEKGLTYGISSSINTFQHDSMLTIATDVNRAHRVSAISEIRRELALLARNGIARQAMQMVKNHFIGSMHSEMVSPFAIMDKVKSNVLQRLPADFYYTLTKHVQNCSTSSLLATAKTYFDESSFDEISVG